MPEPLPRRLRPLIMRLGFEREWYLVFVAAAIGLLMGGVATAFILPLRWVEHFASGSEASTTLYTLVAISPAIGGLLAGVAIQLIGAGQHGSGVSAVMYAVYREKARVPLRTAFRKWIASTLTIGSGGSAGAEGPIVTIGSTIGSNLGRWLRTNPQNTATLLGCGAAAGISSVFNAPIAGIFFVLEILLRDFSLRTITPIVVASVLSAAFTQTMLGQMEPLFPVTAQTFSNADYFGVEEVPNFFLLGIVCGVFAPLFIRALFFTDGLFGRLPVPTWLKPAIGGGLLGLLGLAYLLVIRPPTPMPDFFGNGYPAIQNLLDSATYFRDPENTVLKPVGWLIVTLFTITALKAIGTCLTIGSGGAGGMFAPSLLLGAGVGGTFGVVVYHLGWLPAASPAMYALVGMGAMVASTTHAPLTGILIVYEVTKSEQIILPLMLTAVISVVVARLIARDSVYTWKLTQLGLRLGAMSDLTILRRLTVSDVPLAEAVCVHANDSAQRLLDLSERHAASDFVVIDDHGAYSGMVVGADLRTAMLQREAIPLLLVGELQRTDLPTVTPDEPLDVVLDKFSQHDVHGLAVLHGPNLDRIRGLITRDRLMRRYQEALLED